jgi:hypothetical protein
MSEGEFDSIKIWPPPFSISLAPPLAPYLPTSLSPSHPPAPLPPPSRPPPPCSLARSPSSPFPCRSPSSLSFSLGLPRGCLTPSPYIYSLPPALQLESHESRLGRYFKEPRVLELLSFQVEIQSERARQHSERCTGETRLLLLCLQVVREVLPRKGETRTDNPALATIGERVFPSPYLAATGAERWGAPLTPVGSHGGRREGSC